MTRRTGPHPLSRPRSPRKTTDTTAGAPRRAPSARGWPQLARNFRRAVELTALPDELMLSSYDALRPRASTKEQLSDIAAELERDYGGNLCAQLVREAAGVYERPGILA